MKFAVFFEIPVARPWGPASERDAFHDVVEQAVAAEKAGFESVWTVEHHFLEEYSHCSNPEVLYGAIAARTSRIRIGYGVRLAPKPYNHPVRSAESAAVLDLLSDGRVEFGTGRSATRIEMEGFGVDPNQTREMWQEAVGHIVTCWTEEYAEFAGKHWQMPRRRVQPKPLQKPHPPLWGATGSPDGHRVMGELGLGLLSFSVGTPPEQLKERIDLYREGIGNCRQPIGAVVHDRAACFTMVNCAATRERSIEASRESFEWYARHSAELVASIPLWLEERKADADGTYAYLEEARQAVEQRLHELASLEVLLDMNAVIAGDPDEVIERCRAYEATGADLLLCLINPYKVTHEAAMETIELLGRHVIPAFA